MLEYGEIWNYTYIYYDMCVVLPVELYVIICKMLGKPLNPLVNSAFSLV